LDDVRTARSLPFVAARRNRAADEQRPVNNEAERVSDVLERADL